MTKRILGVVAVFGLGVGFGCAAAPFVVPKASAQQAATLTKWEVNCFKNNDTAEAVANANRLGGENWEMLGVSSGPTDLYCFKRPKM